MAKENYENVILLRYGNLKAEMNDFITCVRNNLTANHYYDWEKELKINVNAQIIKLPAYITLKTRLNEIEEIAELLEIKLSKWELNI